MHPELEDFLNDAFQAITPSGAHHPGRVVVDPDYDVAPDAADATGLARELGECLDGRTKPGEVPLDGQHALLRKYLRSITLHPEPADGPWVEVAPPGNWI